MYERTDVIISKMLLDGDVELAILSGPVDPEKFEYTLLTECPMCGVINVNHPLARFDSVSLLELRDESLIISSSGDFNSYQDRFRLFSQMGNRTGI